MSAGLCSCNCRWDGDTQVQQCTLHQAHVDAIHEWAERARGAEAERDALAAKLAELEGQEPVQLKHLACIDSGELRMLTGRAAPSHDVELYALPDGVKSSALFARPIPAERPVNARLLEALLKVARMAEDLKKPCGTDPESPQAIRNAQYMNISYAARAAIANSRRAEPVNTQLLDALKDAEVALTHFEKVLHVRVNPGGLEKMRAAIARAEAALAAPQSDALEQARGEEREACAAIIQDAATAAANNNDLRGYELLSALGRAIRARGQK